MSRRFPPEVHDFIRENVKGLTNQELCDLVNDKFGPIFTVDQLRAYKSNHKLRGGNPNNKKPGEGSIYPPEIHAFIKENYEGTGPTQMQRMVNSVFGTAYTVNQLKSYYGRYKLNSGITGRFMEGHTPANKGKKGYVAPGAEKGWFKKGSLPKNTQPVGTVLLKSDGYLWKKLRDDPYSGKENWKQLHRIIWEEANGPIPEGYHVVFKDKNRSNCKLENLALISRSENAVLNHSGLRSEDPDYFETGLLVARIKCRQAKIKKAKRRKI